jgi:hypothetical protein
MKKNVGKIDTWIRILVALVILVLYYKDIISGTVAIVLLVLGIVLLLTSLLGFCPLYTIFKINTGKREVK